MQNFKKWWPVLVVMVLSLVITWPLAVPGYFSHHDFLQVMRIFEMRRCLNDGQIPCRWVPDMGYGNGFPLFNFYGPLPYYLGGLVSFVTSYIVAAKVLFFLPLFFGGLTMFLLVNHKYGRWPALVAAVLFTYAPYRAVDSYVRGAVDESFAIALFPLVLWTFARLVETGKLKYLALSSVVLGLFFLSHNIMTMLFTPVLLIWLGLQLWQKRSKTWFLIGLALLTGFGLAAFFLLPAFSEKSLVHTETLTQADLDFRANFVTVKQLFERNWGYGPSIPGPDDTLSFQLGWPLWMLVLACGVVWCWQVLKSKKTHWWRLIEPVFWLAVFGGSVFMMHNQSAFIWERISLLQFAQFPWRFLSLSIISGSLLTGYLVSLVPVGRWQIYLSVAMMVVAVALNFSYFKPETFFTTMTDHDLLTGQGWVDQQKASILDYLPKTAVEPKEEAPSQPLVTSGQAEVNSFRNYSNRWDFQIQVSKPAVVEMPVFDFPTWQVKVNGVDTAYNHHNYVGRVQVVLPPGNYQVQGFFSNTPIRTVSNWLSLLSLLELGGIGLYASFRRSA